MKFRKLENTYTCAYTYIENDCELDVVQTICGEDDFDMNLYEDGLCIAKFTILCVRGIYELYKVRWLDENYEGALLCDIAHSIVWAWNNRYEEMLQVISVKMED